MDARFGLTAEQQDFLEWVRRAADDLADVAARARRGQPPAGQAAWASSDCSAACSAAPPTRPPRDAAAMQLCLLRETLATVNTEAETALALQGLGCYPILQSGNGPTRERWLPGGRRAATSYRRFALSEPDAGSDAGALALRGRARR